MKRTSASVGRIDACIYVFDYVEGIGLKDERFARMVEYPRRVLQLMRMHYLSDRILHLHQQALHKQFERVKSNPPNNATKKTISPPPRATSDKLAAHSSPHLRR